MKNSQLVPNFPWHNEFVNEPVKTEGQIVESIARDFARVEDIVGSPRYMDIKDRAVELDIGFGLQPIGTLPLEACLSQETQQLLRTLL